MTKGLIDRRCFVFSSTLLAASASSTLGWAATAKDAEVLVEKLVAEINAVISSGNSESAMVRQFEEFSNHMLMSRQLRDMPWEMMQEAFHNPKWKSS